MTYKHKSESRFKVCMSLYRGSPAKPCVCDRMILRSHYLISRLICIAVTVFADNSSQPSSYANMATTQSRLSKPLGLARVACFESLACIFAKRGAITTAIHHADLQKSAFSWSSTLKNLQNPLF